MPDISHYFNVGKSSPTSKSKEIRDLFNIGMIDPKWTLPSRMDSNPMAWYVMVDGLVLDVRSLSRHIQEAAYNKGLIPYIPADRE